MQGEPARFAEFWAVFPKRKGKGAAEKAWTAAVKSTAIDVILAGAKRYASDPNLPDDPKFIPLPATWLNQRRWEDDPEPSRNGSRPGPEPLAAHLRNFDEETP